MRFVRVGGGAREGEQCSRALGWGPSRAPGLLVPEKPPPNSKAPPPGGGGGGRSPPPVPVCFWEGNRRVLGHAAPASVDDEALAQPARATCYRGSGGEARAGKPSRLDGLSHGFYQAEVSGRPQKPCIQTPEHAKHPSASLPRGSDLAGTWTSSRDSDPPA
jgi:hypothetical protein